MPPTFITHSKNKMQAWVTNNGPNSPPAPSASAAQSAPQRRHVQIQQPTSSATLPNSPLRSRDPIVHANAGRSNTVMAARIPVPAAGRLGHARDLSLDAARSRPVNSEPLPSSTKRPMPFWDGSTMDGSFSDAASNVGSNNGFPSHHRRALQVPTSYQYQPRETQRHRPIPEASSSPRQQPQFTMGPDGMMNVMNNQLTRSASTPETSSHHNGLKGNGTTPGPEYDQYSEDSRFQESPEKTPSARRLQHPKTLALRSSEARDSFSERSAHARGDPGISSPFPLEVYEAPREEPLDQELPASNGQLRVQVPAETQPRRSTIFADTDTPMVSHPDESDSESVVEIEQPIPKPAPRPRTPVNRKLFAKNSKGKGKGGLDESAMPRPTVTKSPPNAKKRQYEPDYDDGALAAMEYQELKQEAFDFDPAQAEARAVIEPHRGTLPDKLNHYFDKDEASQLEFFTKMSVRDWEDSGDWFLERFGAVVDSFKTARKSKRAVMEGFENEIAEREEAVRNKIQGIDHTLGDLKVEGEGMMQGKEFD
ncbi:extracellular mutant protein 11-domain-containing protein [Xylariaceae sp. FL0804]|nr:extracellular mutant protein 11-domain-containing protein [Xylariaceae sp. FL0804]